MRIKRLGRVLGFAMGGAVLALLHALYLGITAPIPAACYHTSPFLLGDGPRSWVVAPASVFGIRQYDLTADAAIYPVAVDLEQGTVPSWVLRPASGQSAISRGFGWPFVALTGAEVYANKRLVNEPGYFVRSNQDLVPTQLRVGILANSFLFACVAFLLVWPVQVIRARLRHAVNPFACPSCGYDLEGGGPVCPECGRERG